MNLKPYSNDNLESRLKKLVKTERKITHLVLQCIAEIDRRKLYLQKAYPSLFDFLVHGYGYSPSAAMRRIDGARLLQQIPEMAKLIESGSVSLSQVGLLQQAEREIKRGTKQAIPLEIKRELLTRIEHKTQAQTAQLIAQTLNIDISPKNNVIQHKDESVTVTVTLTKEQMKLIEQAQAMLSHAVPEKNWASLITYLAKKELSRRVQKTEKTTKVYSESPSTATTVKKSFHETKPPPATSKTRASFEPHAIKQISKPKNLRKPIPQQIKKQLLHPNTACVFRDPQTGKVCGSRHFLQVDHIKSVFHGGGNEFANLQVLCGQHNRYKFILESRN